MRRDTPSITYVVLAAGSATRMGHPKVVTPLRGNSPLQRIAALLAERESIVVTTDALRDRCAAAAPLARIVVNPRPERGMTSSLRTALEGGGEIATVGVMLADKPLLSRQTLERLEAAVNDEPCDVLYPIDGCGVPGHPVYFSARAIALVTGIAGGDTLHLVRDHPSLSRKAIQCADAGAFVDLDTPEDWATADA